MQVQQSLMDLAEMANALEFDLMQSVLKKPAVNALRSLSSPEYDDTPKVCAAVLHCIDISESQASITVIKTALERMRRYVDQISGINDARAKVPLPFSSSDQHRSGSRSCRCKNCSSRRCSEEKSVRGYIGPELAFHSCGSSL